MRDTGIADRLRRAGLAVVEVDGWQTRGSDSFSPRGGVDHHTAGSNNGNAPSLNVCTHGRSDLPGPLCNVLQGFDGTCYVIASGKANHAGDGSWKGLSGNSSVYGFERENDGHSAPRPGQHESAARAWAAILNGGPAGNIGAEMVCGHREWAPGRKPDFHDLDYGWFRNQINHGGTPGAPPASVTEEMRMFALVQPDDGRGVYRFSGQGMIGVPDPTCLGGDQIMLSVLGLDATVWAVSAYWFNSWPMLRG
jgi:hypothetical protein